MDRNLFLAILLSGAVLLGWELLVAGPQREAFEAQRQEQIAQEAENGAPIDTTGDLGSLSAPGSGQAPVEEAISLDDALAAAPGRITIDTPNLAGSINLQGGRLDDLVLKKYRETLEPDSGLIQLLRPEKTDHAHYLEQGWIVDQKATSSALWTASDGAKLTAQSPVTLTRTQGPLRFTKTISVDETYMFTVTQSVENTGGQDVSIEPYAAVIQHGNPTDLSGGAILHEGAVGVVGKKLYDRKYKALAKGKDVSANGVGGWAGVTNKYWLAAAIPPQDAQFRLTYDNLTRDAENPIFRAFYLLAPVSVPSGGSIELTSYMFGGAKEVDVLKAYERSPEKGGLGVSEFDRAVDWGWFSFLTRPIFSVLNFFGDLTGNYGVAILLLTLSIKLVLFPIANVGYESMTRMKKIQPQLEKLRERYGEDKMKLQQEMMGLYKKEGVNPVAGCLPLLVQMPIFFALYKTLFVTLELRHEPFIGWLKDLSAPDPTNIFNLFGLIPFDPTSLPLIGAFLGIGILPLLMGFGMWFQMSLNPPPPDPTQRQIFAMLPFIFVFLFASFASGLVLYWVWNTILSIVQQLVIMKKNGVEVEWRERFSFLFPKDKAQAGASAASGKSVGNKTDSTD